MSAPPPHRDLEVKVQITALIVGGLMILAVIGGAVVLTALGKDPEVLMILVTAVVVPTLGGLLYGKLGTVERQSNGNLSRLLEVLDRKTPDQPGPLQEERTSAPDDLRT